jgi:hypothetical protein
MPDFDAMGVALAARFVGASVPAPAGGYQAIRLATNYMPNQMPPLPCVLVFPESGDFVSGNGKRESGSTWLVRFYFAQTGALEKDMKALQKWLTVLVDATKGAVQLGGIVELALVDSFKIGMLSYGGNDYSGIELSVHIETHESWLATA